MTVADIITKLPIAFNADAANDMEACFQFEIEGDDDFYIDIADGQCRVELGENDDADVTLMMSAGTFSKVMTGETDGMMAYMSGKLKAAGNVMLCTKLSKLFSLR